MIYLLHKKDIVYVEENGFFSKIKLLSRMHQQERNIGLNKK